MPNLTQEKTPGIIASVKDIPCDEHLMDDYIKKIDGLPLSEIEVDLGTLEWVEQNMFAENVKTTAMINYPLGGYQAEYLLDSLRWAVNRQTDLICTGLPLSWLKSEMENKLAKLLEKIINISQEKPVRISIESSLLSIEELSRICNLLMDAGIIHLKTSSGLPHPTLPEDLSFIHSNYPNLLLAVDNNLRGDSAEIDNLFQLFADYVCIKEPWLYHF